MAGDLANLGALTKPADTLVKKVSNAVGGFFAPYQTERIAKADARAALIKAQSEVAITDLRRRAVHRWIEEEAMQQKNMEDITGRALPQLKESANPDSIDDDWLVNFFDKSRIVSDDEMQGLWSRILAGEANSPGSYSRRTVNFISDLDKSEADLFTRLCGFCCVIGRQYVPLVFNTEADIYNRQGINFGSVSDLQSIGLAQFNHLSGFAMAPPSKRASLAYFGRRLAFEIPKDAKDFPIGTVLLTRIGQQLAPICGMKCVEGFWQYIEEQFRKYSPQADTN